MCPDYPDIIKNARDINNFNIADPIQVVIDLFCMGFAGRDAATKLYEMIRNEQQADILALLDPNPSKHVIKESFNIDVFHGLVKEFKLEFTLTTITELPKYRDSIQLYNPNLDLKQIQKWTKTIVK